MKAGKTALKRKSKTVEGKIAANEEDLVDIPVVKRARKSKTDDAAGRTQPLVANDLSDVTRDAKREATLDLADETAGHKTEKSKRFRSKEKVLLLTARGISSRWALAQAAFPVHCMRCRLCN